MRLLFRFSVAAFVVTTLFWFRSALQVIVAGNTRFGLLHDSSEQLQGLHRVGPGTSFDADAPEQKHAVISEATATTHEPALSSSSVLQSHASHVQPDELFDMVADASTDLDDERLANNTSRPEDKIIVMGKLATDDTSWVSEQLPDWQNAIYTVDNTSAPLHTSHNKGKEALPYLTYLVENYNSLPATIAFLHSHEKGYPQAWHTDAADYSNVRALNTLNIAFVQANGYVNLRCDTSVGCPDEIQPFRSPREPDRTAEHAMADAWTALFNGTQAPSIIATPCCAQFAVSRAQVLKRPRSEYEWYLTYLVESTLDDETVGRVYEYLWHVMFGKESVYCPEPNQCYRDVYGIGTGY